MKCYNCENDVPELFYAISYSRLISNGVTLSRDFIVSVCKECKGKFFEHDPEFPPNAAY